MQSTFLNHVKFHILLCLIIVLAGTSSSLIAQERKPNENLEEIIVVFKTHFDIGYTDLAEAVVQKYSTTMIEEALNIVNITQALPKEKHFVWTLPGWPMKEILERCSPDLKPQIENAIKKGWFAAHALPFTMHTESSDLEDLVRSLSFSSNIAREFGLELPRDAKLTDVPSHSWFIPTLLKNSGIDFLHIGCNPASPSPKVPLLFWWQGPDGSRLMTMYWEKFYGTDIIPPDGWPYKTWIAIIHTLDNKGAPPPEQVEDVLKQAEQLAPNAKIRIGRMSDFYDALIKENPQLPVIKKDMPDSWIHGVMTMPKEYKIGRNVKDKLFTLEALNTLAQLWTKRKNDLSGPVARAYENITLFNEHTFGLAMSHGHSGTWCYGDEFKRLRAKGIYKPIEDSWKEKGDRIYQAEKVVLPSLKKQLHELAGKINSEGKKILVYNSLPWPRNGLVTIQAHSEWHGFRSIKDMSSDNMIRVDNDGNIIRFFVENVPAMGYKTFIPVKEALAEKSIDDLSVNETVYTIENNFFRIKIDPEQGVIASVFDKLSAQELVHNKSQFGFGQYLYERFSKENTEKYANDYIKAGWNWALAELGRPNLTDEPYRSASGANPKITFLKDDVAASAALQFAPSENMPHDYSLIITLYKNQPYIELNWAISGKPAEPWPEAGWICLPFNIKGPEFRLGRLGGIVNPKTDFIEKSNHDYYFLNTGAALIDSQGNGVGVCSPDAPAISLDRPGLWKYSKDFVPEKANVFFNLYNNQWSTNFTEWIEGSWSARFYIWSVKDDNNETSIITPAEELRAPLHAVISEGKGGNLPFQNEGIKLSRKGIKITAFVDNPDGEGTILRLWEQAGNSGICQIHLPEAAEYSSYQQCNLRGESTAPAMPVTRNTIEIEIQKYQPVSIILK